MIDCFFHVAFVFDNTCRTFLENTGLEGSKTFFCSPLYVLRCSSMRVDTNTLSCRATKQFVDRHTKCFSFNVPERLINTTDSTGQHGAPSVKGMSIHRLPVMWYSTRVFADQVMRKFLDGRCASMGSAFYDRFSQTRDSGIGMNFKEQPAWLNQ